MSLENRNFHFCILFWSGGSGEVCVCASVCERVFKKLQKYPFKNNENSNNLFLFSQSLGLCKPINNIILNQDFVITRIWKKDNS